MCGAVASYFIYSKGKSTVAEFAALEEIPAIERGVRNSSDFTPPGSGELTEAQVARYVKVQGQVRSLLGSRFDEFDAKYAELTRRMDSGQGNAFDAPAVIGVEKDSGVHCTWTRKRRRSRRSIPRTSRSAIPAGYASRHMPPSASR